MSIMVGPNPDWNAVSRNRSLWQAMHDMGRSMTAVPRLVAVDQDGLIRLHGDTFPVEPNSLADRQYFQFHRTSASDLPLVGVPIVGRVSNIPSLTVSRRLFRSDGSFAGVAVANLHPQAFTLFFASLSAETGSVVSLQRGDGTLIARYPAMDNAMGSKVDNAKAFPAIAEGLPDGVAITTSPVDGIQRVTAFRRLEHLDLVLLAGLPVDYVLAPWRRETLRMAVVITTGLLILTGLLVMLLARREAQLEAQARLKTSEENLRQAQSIARLGYYVFDMVADEWASSPILDDIFGIDANFVRSGMGWLGLVVPAMRPEMKLYLEGILAGRHEFNREYQITRPCDGQTRWVIGLGRLERDEDGTPIRLVGTIQDITERKLSDQALHEKAEELSRSNTELEQFAYVASHDLREPLRMVSSYVDLLGRRYGDKLDEDAREFIAFARDGATRMDRLVLDLLEYSRIGRITRPMTLVALDKSLSRAMRALEAKIVEAGARIVVENQPLPSVMGDVEELTRLFQNLIGNAVKYRSPERAPVVTVTTARQGAFWQVSVADNGIGIEPQYFERVFLIFQRLHPRGAYEGTGIGLAICKKIAEHHGGRLWVDSVPGEGSAFHVTLPAVD
jgi:PAS domain S-box-containing protein